MEPQCLVGDDGHWLGVPVAADNTSGYCALHEQKTTSGGAVVGRRPNEEAEVERAMFDQAIAALLSAEATRSQVRRLRRSSDRHRP